MSYKVTKKAQTDLAALVDLSLERFGTHTAARYVDALERTLEGLARGDFDGPEVLIASRARPVHRWPVPPYWPYYERVSGELRLLRIYHGAREPL